MLKIKFLSCRFLELIPESNRQPRDRQSRALTNSGSFTSSRINTILANQNVAMIKVERVQNHTLWLSYAMKRQTMLHRQGATDSYERTWLFHGTGVHTVLKIIKQGFNRSFGFEEVNKNTLTMYARASTLPSTLHIR